MATAVSRFPKATFDPKELEDPRYGLQYAKAIESEGTYLNKFGYLEDISYEQLSDFVLGRQINQSTISNATASQNDPTRYIDVKVYNVFKKFFDIALDMVSGRPSEPDLFANDVASVDKMKEFQAKIRMYYDLKQELEAKGVNPIEVFPDIDFDVIPDSKEEFKMDFEMNPKLDYLKDVEAILNDLYETMDMQMYRRKSKFDDMMTGIGIRYMPVTTSGKWCIHHVHPLSYYCSAPYNDNFDECVYHAHEELITADQFVQEAKDSGLSEMQVNEIIKHNAHVQELTHEANSFYANYVHDNINRIRVMRFQFKATAIEKYVKSPGKNKKSFNLKRKEHTYTIPQSLEHEFKSGKRKYIEYTYESWYAGTYVMGTNILYNYGRKPTYRGYGKNVVYGYGDYIVETSNIKNYKISSMAAECLGPATLATAAFNKITEAVTNGYVGQKTYNFDALTNVAEILSSDSAEKISALEAAKILDRLKINLQIGSTNFQDIANAVTAIDVSQVMTVADFEKIILFCMQSIRNITGINEYVDGTAGSNSLVGTIQAAQVSSNRALSRYYESDRRSMQGIYRRLTYNIAALSRNKVLDQYITRSGFPVHIDKDLLNKELVVNVRSEYNPERERFVRDAIMESIKNGQIDMSVGYFLLYEINNPRKAMDMLNRYKRITRKRAERQQQEAIQQNAQIQQQSLMMKGEQDQNIQVQKHAMELEKAAAEQQMKIDGQLQVEQLKGMMRQQEQAMKGSQQEKTDAMKTLSTSMEVAAKKQAIEKRKDKSPED